MSGYKKNRVYHWSLMQTEKSQPQGKWIMLETRFAEFPALSIDPRVGISRFASETDDFSFSDLLLVAVIRVLSSISLNVIGG